MECKRIDLSLLERSPTLESVDSVSLELEEALRILPKRREVYRSKIVDSGRAVVAKFYLPHPKQERDWRREWDNLRGLAERGLPVPEPLGVYAAGNDCVCVLMQCIEEADTLGAFLKTAPAGGREKAMRRLVELVDALHAKGARQMDQHIDNWVVADGKLWLLDAGSYQLSDNALSAAGRLEDLAAICATLPPLAEKDFRSALGGLELEARIVEVQATRARRYFKKTQRECSEFGEFINGKWQGMFFKAADPDVVKRFFADPDALMNEGARLKSGNTCTVQRVGNYVLKRYNKKPFWGRLRRSFRASRARKSWSNAWVLDLSFIPTASPVAFAESRGFPRERGYLLMNALDGELLPDYLEHIAHGGGQVESLVEQVGRIWDSLGRLRAVHGDLKATNWMVGDDGKVSLFDLDSLRFGLSGSTFQKGRRKDLARFLKNWESKPSLAKGFSERMQTPVAS